MKTMYYLQRYSKRSFMIACATMVVYMAAVLPNEVVGQGCTLACPPMDPPTQISLSQECEDTLTAEALGVVPTNCSGELVVELFDEMGQSYGNIITGDMIDQTFMVVVTVPDENNQACMFAITVVDKMPPVVECPDHVTVMCPTPLDEVEGLEPDDVDDCNDFTIQYVDVLQYDGQCDEDIVALFMRFYSVVDVYGNIATCTQYIAYEQVGLDDIEFPEDLKGDDALACYPEPDTTPANTGSPSVDGFPISNGTICNILVSYDDQKVPICTGSYKLVRTWTIMDWCTNTSTMTVQIIEIRDTTPPEVDVIDELEVPAGPGCEADVLLPAADVTEDCSTEWTVRMQGPFGTIQQNGGLIEGLPAGHYEIIYFATNDCGLEGSDTLWLDITDQSTPSALCNASVAIPLNDMGMTLVPAEGFDGGSFDNCSDVYFKAKRMSAPNGYDCYAGDNDTYAFDDVVKFCCEDVSNGPIMVIMRVYDVPVVPGQVSDDYLAGHFTDCMIEVEVQDKVGPSIECPSDITISCEYDFDPDNLSVFGVIVDDPADREEICIDDPGDFVDGLTCLGLDGLATDNCGVTIEEEMSMIMDSICGTGQIIRTFTATDPGGKSASCQQVITITNYKPFTEADIDWPEDFVTTDICDIDALDPEDLPYPYNEPVLSTDQCDLATFNYVDEVFDFSGSSEACFKILRTWTVIDWCQINATSGESGKWTHLQVIKVKNTVPPVILSHSADEDLCSDDPGCGDATTTLEASADDDCTAPETFRWRISIDLDNNGTIDDFVVPNIGESVAVNYSFPIGNHRVLYAVQDFCSNTAVEEQFISVESCAGPSAKCQDITTTLMPVDSDNDGESDGGSVVIWASDLDAGSDHICGLEVSVAFSADPLDTHLEFTCDDIGENEVELWVIDENGLTDFCTVTVTIQDNNGVCPDNDGIMGVIAGAIATSGVQDMDDVMVQLHGSGLGPQYTEDGHYAFQAMPFGGTYEVEPQLNTNHKNGVSTIDLIQIQKHLLGLKQLNSPYKIIAADANNSGSVSAVDILELRKLILGIYDELPNNTSWRFVDKAYSFIDPANPLAETFPESYMIDPFSTDMTEVDFVGVKIGDVNESAQALGAGSEETGLTTKLDATALQLEDIELQAGEIRDIQLRVPRLGDVEAMQFTLEWDRTRIDIMEVVPGERATHEQWNDDMLDQGILPFSWHKYEVAETETDQLITLRVRAIRSGMLSEAIDLGSSVTKAEALTESGAIAEPHLTFNPSSETDGFVLHQNVPNPFTEHTTIAFDIEESAEVELLIYDVLGRMHYSVTREVPAGYNTIEISAADISARGLLIYTLKVDDKQQTKRMIID